MTSHSETRKHLVFPRIIALSGFMAAGKSTIGRVLASLLHWHFIDLDCEIECRTTLSIQEIFVRQGEARFREIEAAALRGVLEHVSTSTVIALGGGTYVQQVNADLLQNLGVHVVFLELPVEELLQRCRASSEHHGQNPRPLASDPEAFRALYAERLPFYRRAKVIVNAYGRTAEEVAQEIAEGVDFTASVHRGQ